MTATYGIIGFPVAHTRSPAMHSAAFRALGIDAEYVALRVPPEELEATLRGLAARGISGVNVTLPHKERALALVDTATADATVIGAVNTIVREGDRLVGHDTDAAGLERALEAAGVALAGSRAVVLGAGGAARAAVVGLARAGAVRVAVAARRVDRAEALVSSLGRAVGAELSAVALESDALRAELAAANRVVQATSATLGGGAVATRFAAALPIDALPEDAVVVDMVYEPLETAVLSAARARGLRTLDGLGMLLHQGAIAFEIFTGEPAPLVAMRDALVGVATIPPPRG